MLSEKELLSLLKLKEEKDWLDFKLKWKLYDSQTNKMNTVECDEMIKDVIGLANGNASIIKKTKYLVIGAHDSEFDADGVRELLDVNYKVPSQSEITKFVNSACTPAIVGIEAEFISIKNRRLYVVSIPPTFELHETTRVLSAKSHHSEHTVFMRQDEHTRSASVRDGITIQELKYRHRHEIINPSSVKFGVMLGAIIALVFWNGAAHEQRAQNLITVMIIQMMIAGAGAIIGAEIGYVYREGKATHYDWPYMSSAKKKLILAVLGIAALTLIYFLIQKFK